MEASLHLGLAKSMISAFEQCPKRLWLQAYRPELAIHNEAAQVRFATGNKIGVIARALHPNRVMVEAEPDLRAALQETTRLIAEGHPGPIFGATFEHDAVLVRADILAREGDGWTIAEITSSTQVRNYHRSSLATQVWVMRQVGIDLKSAAIRHVNRSFVLEREGEYNGLLQDSELLGEISDLLDQRATTVADARAVLAGPEPNVEIGPCCYSPFECEFSAHCDPDDWRGAEWLGWEWIEAGIKGLRLLSENDLESRRARLLTEHPAAITRWSRLWLEFDTISSAVPRWIGTRPYQPVPFLFSLYLEQNDGTITHHEFLSCDGSDPRGPCAAALVAAIPQDATIIAGNAGFTKRLLRDLVEACPEHARTLLEMVENTVDMMPPSTPIDYCDLEMWAGIGPQALWLEAANPATDADCRRALERHMKGYCEVVTREMMMFTRYG